MKKFLIPLAILVCLVIVGYIFINQKSLPEYYGDTLITSKGTYPISLDNKILKIDIENGSVKYQFTEAGEIVASTTRRFSDYHRWAFYYDSTSKKLWVYTSDIGGSVWEWKNNIFIERVFSTEFDLTTMPKALFDYLPSSLKRKVTI